MYPLLPPLCINERWLVDGVFSSPLPVIEAVKHGMDVIIVMLFHEEVVTNPKKFIEGFSNITRALSLIKSELSLAIDLHHYDIIVIINVPFENPVSMSGARLIPGLLELVDGKKEDILETIKRFWKNA